MEFEKINSTKAGTLGELIVASDLLKRGYEVFRALHPDASCDLVAIKNGKVSRIEVRTGKRLKENKLTYGSNKMRKGNRYDIMAIYLRDDGGEVVYLENNTIV